MELPLIEPVTVPDTFATGLARIEDIGGCLRFTFYALEHVDGFEGLSRVIKMKLIMVPDAVSAAAAKTLAAMDTSVSLDLMH